MKKNRQEYAYQENTSRVKPVLSGLLIGGLIGVGTALLFAPQAGEETRAAIQHKTMELRDRTTEGVKEAVAQVKSKTRQVTSGVLGKAQEVTRQGRDALEHGMDDISQMANSKKKAIQDYSA